MEYRLSFISQLLYIIGKMSFLFKTKETMVDRIKRMSPTIAALESKAHIEKEIAKINKLVLDIYSTLIVEKNKTKKDQSIPIMQALVFSDFLYNVLLKINLLEFEQKKQFLAVLSFVFRRAKESFVIDEYLLKPENSKIIEELIRMYVDGSSIVHLIGEVLRSSVEEEKRQKIFVKENFITQLGEMINSCDAAISIDALNTLNSLILDKKNNVKESFIENQANIKILLGLFRTILSSNSYMKRFFIEKFLTILNSCEKLRNAVFMDTFLTDIPSLKASMKTMVKEKGKTKMFSLLIFFKFVLYKGKTQGINAILEKNKPKIFEFLKNLQQSDNLDKNDLEGIEVLSKKVEDEINDL